MKNTLTSLYTTKIIIALIVLTAIYLLKPNQVVNIYIVLGLGHFLLAYWYRKEAGKLSGNYFAIEVFSGLALFSIFTLYFFNQFLGSLLLAFTSIYFLFHFLMDEQYLFDEELSFEYLLDVLPIIFLYTAAIIDFIYAIQITVFFKAFALFIFLLNISLVIIKKRNISNTTPYFSVLSLMFLSIYLLGIDISIYTIFGGIVLFHYLNWYIYYYEKLRYSTEKRLIYLKRTFLVNLFFIFLFIVYTKTEISELIAVLGYLFIPTFFYIWTVLHIVFTTRWSHIRILTKTIK